MAQRELDDRMAALLNEYSACQSSVESLDASVWQSAAIIGLVSIGTLGLVVANNPVISASIIVGVFSTLGTFTWWRMANRWWSVRDAKIERMRHIEEDLGVAGQSHYIDYMDDLHQGRSSKRVPHDDPQIRTLSREHNIRIARARELAGLEYERKGPKDALKRFPWVTLIAWTLYIVLRVIGPIWESLRIKFFVLPFWGW